MDRDALVERMAAAIIAAGYNPATAHDIARAALAIAEPTVREDCAAHLDAMAALSSSPHDIDAWTEAAAAIRARKEART